MITRLCIIAILAALAGGVIGFAFGECRGRALGWMEYFDAEVRKADRLKAMRATVARQARRARNGRFTRRASL